MRVPRLSTLSRECAGSHGPWKATSSYPPPYPRAKKGDRLQALLRATGVGHTSDRMRQGRLRRTGIEFSTAGCGSLSRTGRLAWLGRGAGRRLRARCLPATSSSGSPARRPAVRRGRVPLVLDDAGLHPDLAWGIRDHAIRCNQDPVHVRVKVPSRLAGEARGRASFHSTDFTIAPDDARRGVTVTLRRHERRSGLPRFLVRCLPPDFPPYRFGRTGAGGPPFFMVQMNNNYAVIFNSDGVPCGGTRPRPAARRRAPSRRHRRVAALAGGGTSGGPFEDSDWTVSSSVPWPRRGASTPTSTSSSSFRTAITCSARIRKPHLDASPYGGSSNATVTGYQIQEVTPEGQLVWKWDSLEAHRARPDHPAVVGPDPCERSARPRHPALERGRARRQVPPPVVPAPGRRLRDQPNTGASSGSSAGFTLRRASRS